MAAFLTTGQPVSDTILKEIIFSLRALLHSDLVSSITKCKVEAQVLGNSVHHVEGTMGDYSASFHTLAESHNAHNEEITWLKNKIADLKDPQNQGYHY